MHNLTGKDFLSGIVRDLKMEHKELLYFLSLQIKLFVGYSLYHIQYWQNKKRAASVNDYRCCPLKIYFDPFLTECRNQISCCCSNLTIQLMAIKFAVRELCGQSAAGFVELF